MKTELTCPNCEHDVEVDYDITKEVTCVNCNTILKLENDAEFVDGSWRDLSTLVEQKKH